jgi:hypothetical protein
MTALGRSSQVCASRARDKHGHGPTSQRARAAINVAGLEERRSAVDHVQGVLICAPMTAKGETMGVGREEARRH